VTIHSKIKLEGLVVTYRGREELKPHPTNAKLHGKEDIARVMKSVRTYGWTIPILIDEQANVLAGHARLEAAKQLGLEEVPTICISHMTPAQKRAYIIADNRLCEIGGKWSRKLLALEHEAIQLLDPEFDLTATGFELDDIEIMFENELEGRDDEVPEPDRSRAAVSRLGDLWILGEHRLLCSDALLVPSFEQLMGNERAQLVITDAPYNVEINGNVSGRGKHREFVQASGEMSRDEFTSFLSTAFGNLIAFSLDGSIHFLFMDWRHLAEMVAATAQYTEFKNLICWNKHSAGMGTFYRSKHELVFVMKNGKTRHINNFGLGEKGRHRSNVWDYAGLSGWTPDRNAELAMHPTVKPVPMIVDALKDCSRKDGIVLDCFGGSGTTIIAAEQVGRRARVIELDPHYVDISIRRWQAATGEKAVLLDSGRTFDELEKEGR
jgi:DNA modification methylase